MFYTYLMGRRITFSDLYLPEFMKTAITAHARKLIFHQGIIDLKILAGELRKLE